MSASATSDVLWFTQIDKHDVGVVGGKGANLGEMVAAGFPVPDGFVVTASAYFSFLDQNDLRPKIKQILEKTDVNNSKKLQAAAKKVQEIILKGKLSKDLQKNIVQAYLKIGKNTLVAVRSSATAEDLPEASFAGQQETYLNIKGEASVIKHVQKAWASLFEPRAIFYRATKGFDHFKVGIAVPVQRMVQSDISGVMFSINPVTNDKRVIVIEAIWGLGENIVQGKVTPDHYEVEKDTWELLSTQVVEQKVEMVKKMGRTKDYSVPGSRRKKPKLTPRQTVALAKLGAKLQKHYFFPQDAEWAIENGQIYIVQTRPITTIANIEKRGRTVPNAENLLSKLPVLFSGDPASPGIASGKVRFIPSPKDINKLQVGEIMVTSMTTPDFVPAMKKAAGLITDRGGQTSHAAIVSRELGLPCVVGTKIATKKLKTGQGVSLNGRTGHIYNGLIDPKELEAAIAAAPTKEYVRTRTATKVYVNLAEPELAGSVASRYVDGVGLLRAEFMIAQLGYHPKKLIREGKSKVFVQQLAAGISQICAAFGERPVVYRATDFKTNEYRHLRGGEEYEPEEENPLIGYRGAYRYMSDPKVFDLELQAIKKVREKHSNLWIMIPFVRSVQEFQKVKSLIYASGLRRSSTFKIWMMAELPENIIMVDDYINAGVDGFSIGTNDLTMLILGTDRDNENVTSEYDERHPAVQWALERIIRKCRTRNVAISVCGQGPSTYHELATQLVEWGVTSLSVSPDAIESTREIVAAAESRLTRRK